MHSLRTFLTQLTVSRFFWLALYVVISVVIPAIVFGADEYVPLAGLPKLASQGTGLGGYVNQLYIFLIVVGSILAAVKISLAGFKYALSGIVTDKEQAKKDIRGVLIGLAILLLPYIILSTINSTLVNLDVLTVKP